MKKLVLLFLLFISFFAFSKTIHISSEYVEPTENLITYQGNVVVFIDSDNFGLKTNSMQIKKIQNKWIDLSATSTVQITFENGTLEGENLKYNIETQLGSIENASLTILDAQSSETIYINCDNLVFDLNNNYFTGTSNKNQVNIIKGAINAKSDKFIYDRENGELILEGNVELIDNEKDIKMKASKIVIDTQNNNMKGEKVQIEIVVE
ncbi:MAG: hypothetical protein H0Z24_08245 [Thermosipho sp. (in: Bacteria)]|nr:hypothetical protein [Thermosipho sp. (in: thermotogales)]